MASKKDLEDFENTLDKVFKEEKNTTPSKIVNPVKTKSDNDKKLKVVGWVASSLSIIGIILNAYLIIWCWVVWIVSNFVWIYWATKKKEWSQVFLWVVFTLANLYGWYLWAISQ